MPFAFPFILKYGPPLLYFGLGHLVGWFAHKKYSGPSIKDIAKS